MKPANHITNMGCFEQVASVLGNSRAQVELFKVVHINRKVDGSGSLATAFTWEGSPQGSSFWAVVFANSKKRKPLDISA